LVILDTCEHLVDAVAALAVRIFVAAPQVHILATSRESLRVEDEHVLKLDTLVCPPDTPALTISTAQTYPATRLFLERATAGDACLKFSDLEAPIVASICRRLDGVALAIELAARRIGAHGLLQTAELLDQHLALLWTGLRTAPPRQKTLRATIDWSYGLLSERERRVLRRLAVFVGEFSIEAALEVVTSVNLRRSADSLLAKSMVVSRPLGATMRYRLLDTTRAYTIEIKIDEVEFIDLAARHATYFLRLMNKIGPERAGP
jgi:predicted ATPase